MQTNNKQIGIYRRDPPAARKWEDAKRKRALKSTVAMAETAVSTGQLPSREDFQAVALAEAPNVQLREAIDAYDLLKAAADFKAALMKGTAAYAHDPEVEAVRKAFGLDKKLYEAKRQEILVHNCYEQRRGDTKSHRCQCYLRIAYADARNLIEKGYADFVLYKRRGQELQNRKSIVLTAEFNHMQAKSADSLNHKLPLSLSDFIGYHASAVCNEAHSDLDPAINNVRRGTIAERKKEVEANRRHRVSAKGHSIDSDSTRVELAEGNGVGQMNAGENKGRLAPGAVSESEGRKERPKSVDEVAGKSEEAEWIKEGGDVDGEAERKVDRHQECLEEDENMEAVTDYKDN
jgi:hypothetical protein